MPEPAAASAELAPEPQFASLRQQNQTASLGIWAFLATEVLFFGGLLLAYGVFRRAYPLGFAEAGRETKIVIGTINTVVLLTSSATMAWAVHAAEAGRRRLLVLLLTVTAAFGAAFMTLKGVEYVLEYHEHLVPGIDFRHGGEHPHAIELFFFIYFLLTGIHAVHLSIGIGIVSVMAVRAWRGAFSPIYYAPVEVTGLYWHFVDLVWIFLYPLIYLNGRAG
jgi:cytochrome c oxidase subunit 3